jgi:hypothetical protein
MEFLLYLLVISAIISLAALITNPFSKTTIVSLPYKVRFSSTEVKTTDESESVRVRQRLFWRLFAIIKSGTHIMHTRYVHSKRSKAKHAQGVIRDIHRLRYDPRKLLLISGDHFSGLFVRNLGVFLYPVLDRNFAISEQDWKRRQSTYLQTVAYALAVFAKHDTLTTTIMPTSRLGATCVNFYAYPSDTLYGILFALAASCGQESAQPYGYGKAARDLAVKPAADELLTKHQGSLAYHYATYRHTVFDESAGLIKRSIHLSGAKDITKRTCAFYDNVIFWKTTQLAMMLGIIPDQTAFLDKLKTRILDTYWLDEEGYFLEDLSEPGVKNKYYSSDWLIVLATGFLDPLNKLERRYYERSVEYIRQNGLDQPFPIKYQHDTRADRQFLAVRIAVASYGGDAIWSFWGMEYIKTLLILYKTTKKTEYLALADRHIAAYEANIVRYGGFPEVYDNKGNLLETRMYRSICMTSWVIGFEQVQAIRSSL